MDLVLIRHPAVDVPPGVCYGQSDLALTATPVHAVAAITSHLRARGPIIACFTSPLKRCADVAQALVQTHSHATPPLDSHDVEQGLIRCPLVSDARLAEIDFGQWEMQRWDDIPRRQIDDWAADVLHGRPHRGESAQMVADRCAAWLHDASLEIARDSGVGAVPEDKASPAPCVLVIGHAGPIRLLTALALGLPLTTTLQWPLDFGGVVTLKRHTRHTSAQPLRPASASARASDRPSARWTLRQWNG